GYRFYTASMLAKPNPVESSRLISSQQASAWLQLALSEQIVAARGDAVVVFAGTPNLAIPACGMAYAISPSTDSRQLSTLLQEVFGIKPWLVPETDSLAKHVLATTESVHGHAIPLNIASQDGFESFAANLEGLRKAGGDLLTIYSSPAESSH